MGNPLHERHPEIYVSVPRTTDGLGAPHWLNYGDKLEIAPGVTVTYCGGPSVGPALFVEYEK